MMRKELIRLLGDGKAGELEQKNVVKQKQGGSFRGGHKWESLLRWALDGRVHKTLKTKFAPKRPIPPPLPALNFFVGKP